MPRWTKSTVGGGWDGGGTEVENCNLTQRNRITNAFNNFISSSCLDCFPGLRACLREKWEEVEIDCDCSDLSGLDGRRRGNKIWLCVTNINRIGALLLHELVHVCGGTELDSEAVEHACFNGNGATLPTSGDWPKFISETDAFQDNENERVGKFVIWNRTDGRVWGKTTEGGGWGDSEIIKGSLCFQDSNWINTGASGGGWS
ncbi:hypothetical protein [Salinimicrobium sediminilitoris]|uniref:hypothetical protein n=1 Tax=Salinimicrobium sediminilitoris TaxID=2876715 RepID=UPI001E303587|nr:hypothetical protein [Salinimicrobium sediminilitoris]MCC8358382.1 hypothetical protein [Salinimicrobium sediminilitoris]